MGRFGKLKKCDNRTVVGGRYGLGAFEKNKMKITLAFLMVILMMNAGVAAVEWKPDLSILKTEPKNWTETMKTQAMYAGILGGIAYMANLKTQAIVVVSVIAYGLSGASMLLYAGMGGAIWGYARRDRMITIVSLLGLYYGYQGWKLF